MDPMIQYELAQHNRQVYEDLSKIVIGHDKAKKVLINLVNRSKFRYYQKWGLLKNTGIVNLSNCLLIGDSGTGKTFLVESLSNLMKFPYIKIDATDLTLTGAGVGLKPNDVIRLIKKKAEELLDIDSRFYYSIDGILSQMIVFVDEIDKLGLQSGDGWNTRVQGQFLTFFENKRELEDLTFIFAGAFSNIDKYNKISKNLGFVADKNNQEKSNTDLHQSIIKFGLIPELVGRMHHVVLLDKLSEADYRKILFETILPKVRANLLLYGITEFNLSGEQIIQFVDKAVKSGLGVRGLETSVNELLVDAEFDPLCFTSDPLL